MLIMDVNNIIKIYNDYENFHKESSKMDKSKLVDLFNSILNKSTFDGTFPGDNFIHYYTFHHPVLHEGDDNDYLNGFFWRDGVWWGSLTNGDIKLRYLNSKYLVLLLGSLLEREDIIIQLNKNIFKQINEGVESAPAETRLNTFKNFNHFNKDQMGGMEIFAPRVNTEINRISDEMFDDEDEDNYENDGSISDEDGSIVEDPMNPYDHEDVGLVINDEEDNIETPERSLDYPYGMGNNPKPTFKMDNNTQSKSNIIFRFADYRSINNFR